VSRASIAWFFGLTGWPRWWPELMVFFATELELPWRVWRSLRLAGRSMLRRHVLLMCSATTK
jgi:hypothetical protein